MNQKLLGLQDIDAARALAVEAGAAERLIARCTTLLGIVVSSASRRTVQLGSASISFRSNTMSRADGAELP